ncbi:hypothetical protein JRO89_XSUnG0110000 [Xanthoceras sorbifolium]|uniref:Uncharacterized protein n=1 Tax=Xanthoceras sorbifolium TaxID=99658 RepID=A0ABQ8GYK2_9ROSI|nr:hypothetical protein JRO89_XSUnG0110000 [Xanthoceras sorbifolium]
MAADLDIELYGSKTRPSSVMNSIFMYTVNMAAKTLVSVAQSSKTGDRDKWKTRDHLRFMVMLMTWLTVWILRVLMDHFPITSSYSYYHLESVLGPSSSSSSSSSLPSSGSSSLDLVLYQGFDTPSVKALGRALTHILALVNEMPATSTKYQFLMAMADRIMEGNARDDHEELLQVNRTALSSAFARTSNLLYRSLQSRQSQEDSTAWPTRAIKALPLGSYIAPYLKGFGYCVNLVMSLVDRGYSGGLQKRREVDAEDEEDGEIMAEKLAQELLWITNKLRLYGDVEQALFHWSFSSALASLSLTANPRVQGLILKISAILFGDVYRENNGVSREVKFRLIVLWLPLFCHASNGVAYPVLTSFEKVEIERAMDEIIATLPAADQEIILTNWLQDFTVSASEWPNLQISYDRWCQSARQLV